VERLGSKQFRYVILLLVVSATIYFLYTVRQVITPFFIAMVLAYLIAPVVSNIEQRGLRRTWAILMVYAVLGLGLFLFFWYGVPAMADELGQVARLIPHYVGEAEKMAYQVEQMTFPADSIDNLIDETVNRLREYIYKTLRGFLDSILGLVSSLFAAVFAPILAFYILKDWELIRDNFLNLMTVKTRQEVIRLGRSIDEILKGFITGNLLVALIVGVLTGGLVALLGVKFALLIGLICGVTELFPYFGPILGAIPSISLAYAQSPRLAVYVALVLLVVQQVEANLLSPRILGEKVGLHPLLVVFALLAGGKLYGIWGMLLGVPAAAVLKILSSHFYHRMVS
jgi:predicted PurR-regulated permease PerM